uniref:THAP-type domain-containing protein n=1 Tax=Cyprinus carpio TaxID=7962 RepID=A0A8C1JC12_CYPCA
MVNYCRVSGCTNRTDREKHLEYYRLPKVIKNQGEECQRLSEERRRLWLAKLNQDLRGKNLDNIRICSAHFLSGKKSDLYQKDDPDWVPSVGLTGQQGGLPQSTKETGNSHYKRRMNRTQQRLKAEAAAAAETDDDPTTSYVSDNFCCTGTQTELTGDAIEAMTTKLQSLRTENIQLSSDVAHVSTSYDQSAFVDKDEKVLFFTGLPTYQILLVLFTFLSPHLPVRKSLDKFKQLMLTLMRLRLNVSTTFLSYAFNVVNSHCFKDSH